MNTYLDLILPIQIAVFACLAVIGILLTSAAWSSLTTMAVLAPAVLTAASAVYHAYDMVAVYRASSNSDDEDALRGRP